MAGDKSPSSSSRTPMALSPRRLGRRPASSSTAHDSAWDVPPAVASPSTSSTTESLWKARRCVWKTPQRLASLRMAVVDTTTATEGDDDSDGENAEDSHDAFASSLTCPPLLWNQKYLVVAFLSGDIGIFGNIVSCCVRSSEGEPENDNQLISPLVAAGASTPLATLALPTDATIVSILPLTGTEGIEDTLLLLSVEGHIYRVRLAPEEDGSSNPSTSPPSPFQPQPSIRLELVSTWATNHCGATSMCLLPTLSHKKDTPLLLIGYDSGHLESWKFIWSAPTRRPKLLWRGLVPWDENSDLVPLVKSVGILRRATVVNEDGESSAEQLDILVVIQAQPLGGAAGIGETEHEPPMIQVLDARAIEQAATTAFRPSRSSMDDTGFHDAMPLTPYHLLPDPAMDLLDPAQTLPMESSIAGTNNSNRNPPHLPQPNSAWVSSRGTNQLCPLPSGSCGVALSNGMVANVSSGWGIAQDSHQVLLSYPTIGMGYVSWDNEDHLVCCLRGGTCYFIPLTNRKPEQDESSEIPVMAVPHDLDDDVNNVYIQSFTAGSLRLEGKSVPVLVFCFPGGTMDIYSWNEVLPEKATRLPSEEDQFLQELFSRDGQELYSDHGGDHPTNLVDMVDQMFQQINRVPNHDLLQDPAWSQAYAESRMSVEGNDDPSLPKSLDELQANNHWPMLRTLLLDLASS